MRIFAYKQTKNKQTKNSNTETTLSLSSVDTRGSWPILIFASREVLIQLDKDPVKVIRSILVICRVSYFLAWPHDIRYSKILVSHAMFFFVTKMLYLFQQQNCYILPFYIRLTSGDKANMRQGGPSFR